MQTKMLIGGELVAGDGAATPVLDPATGKEVASVNEASPAQIEAACAAAGEAFESFGQTTPAERSAMLLAIADAIEAHNDELAELESLDCGKPFAAARDDEMPLTIDTFRFMAGAARTQGGSAAGEYVEGHTSMIRKDPIGPVASIAPWNYPLMMASWKLAAPLAAGCPVVLKPSEMTPLATLRLAEILNGILPAGVLNVIHGDGAGVGNSLINNPGVEGISITGSPATGMTAMKAASQQIRHVHLELGGKAPVIVFGDADIDAVVETIHGGAYFNAGQDCAQPCRIMVEDSVYDPQPQFPRSRPAHSMTPTPKWGRSSRPRIVTVSPGSSTGPGPRRRLPVVAPRRMGTVSSMRRLWSPMWTMMPKSPVTRCSGRS